MSRISPNAVRLGQPDYWVDPTKHDQPVIGKPGQKRKFTDDEFLAICCEESTLARIGQLSGFRCGSALRYRLNALIVEGRLTKRDIIGDARRRVTVYQSVTNADGEPIEPPPPPPSVEVSVTYWQGPASRYRIELMLEGRHDDEQRYYAYVSTMGSDGDEWVAMTKTMRSEDYALGAAQALACRHAGISSEAAKRRR